MWDDVLAWERTYGRLWDGVVIAANDVGSHWPRYLDHWVTLHPEKLAPWKALRARYGFDGGCVTWGRRAHAVDVQIRPWAGGASGMLAVQVAQVVGCTRVVLCGVPMTKDPHFVESVVHTDQRKPWNAVAGHWRAWQTHAAKMLGWTKSMSGNTAELLGSPSLEWLRGGA